jgi:hypothetical protein
MNLWIYADETNFERKAATGHQTAGYGVLLTTSPISHTVVREALASLAADPDRYKPLHKRQDDATLTNQYFHAADDSQNAHSHLCDSIRKHVSGRFTYLFEDGQPSQIPDLKQLYRNVLQLALVEPRSLDDWSHIEEIVAHWISAPPEPARVHHLAPILDEGATGLSNANSQDAPKSVRAIATAYLCLFDTIPFWTNTTDPARWRNLAARRTTAAAVAKMGHEDVRVQMFVNDVVRFRRSAMKRPS